MNTIILAVLVIVVWEIGKFGGWMLADWYFSTKR